jgi:pimeloyl-ACP methyl ester carboxylesterase
MRRAPQSLDCPFHHSGSGALGCPVLLLAGSVSPDHPYHDSTRALTAVLLDARMESLPGQDHLGLKGAPQLVARLIAEFLVG